LERGAVKHKYYAENVGFILGVMVKGGDERTELVRIITRGARRAGFRSNPSEPLLSPCFASP
jgi:hypothetical protein